MRKLPERNAVITRRVLEGAPCQNVAGDYGLSGPRVLSIVTATFKDWYPQYRWRFDLGLARMRHLYRREAKERT